MLSTDFSALIHEEEESIALAPTYIL